MPPKISNPVVEQELRAILGFSTGELQKQYVENLKNRHPELAGEIATYVTYYTDATTPDKALAEALSGLPRSSGSSATEVPVDKLSKPGASLQYLRAYAQERHKIVHDMSPALITEEQNKFAELYQKILPHVPEGDIEELEAEYKFLLKYGFNRDHYPSYPELADLYVMGTGVLNIGLNTYEQLSAVLDAPQFRLQIYGPYLQPLRLDPGQLAMPLSPYELKLDAGWGLLGDILVTGGSLLTPSYERSGDGPRPADEQPQDIPGFAVPNTTISFILSDTSFDRFRANMLAGTWYRRLPSAGVPFLDIPAFRNRWLSPTIEGLFDVGKLMHVSAFLHTTDRAIEKSQGLAFGDGTQCSSADAEEIRIFRINHPEHANLSDDDIRELICGSDSIGSNEALPALKQTYDYVKRGDLQWAYMNGALHRNLTLGTQGLPGIIAGGGLILVQPLLNQAVLGGNGFQTDSLGMNYALELGALGATALSWDRPELRQPLAQSLKLWTDAFALPEFNVRTELHLRTFGEDPAIPFHNVNFGVETALDAVYNFGAGIEAGDMFARGLRAKDPWTKIQFMSPLILGVGAHLVRGVKYGLLYSTNGAEISGLSDDQVSDLQSEYARSPGWSLIPEIASPALYLAGALWGALKSGTKPSKKPAIGFGENGGLLGGHNWRLNPSGAGLLLEGNFN